MTEIVCAALAFLGVLATAVFGYLGVKAKKEAREREKRAEEREAKEEARQRLREEKELLQLEMQNANNELTEAVANAVLGGHNNGNVERAYAAVAECRAKYAAFMSRIVAHQVAK